MAINEAFCQQLKAITFPLLFTISDYEVYTECILVNSYQIVIIAWFLTISTSSKLTNVQEVFRCDIGRVGIRLGKNQRY